MFSLPAIGLNNPPSSQLARDRQIGFVLTSGGRQVAAYTFSIRPEELTRTQPSRISVQQTLGGAWADSFGAGLTQVNISGHTGWRAATGSQDDGQEKFRQLKTRCFEAWHAERAESIKGGRDPKEVELVFVDELNKATSVVAPLAFTLRRSKQRPLLMQYQMSMIVLRELAQKTKTPPVPNIAQQVAAGLQSISRSINSINGMIADTKRQLLRDKLAIENSAVGISDSIVTFMRTSANLFDFARATIFEDDRVEASLVNVARATAQAGYNTFHSLSATVGISPDLRALLMRAASEFTNVFCVFKNSLRTRAVYADYSDFYGASNCSSTAGGSPASPLADINPFYLLSPINSGAKVMLSEAASVNLRGLAAADILLALPARQQINNSLIAINSGVLIG